jgi:hypothetical protein
MPEVKCLARALTAQILLNRQGYLPKLCIGVSKGQNGKLQAHAWIECQGQVVIGNLSNLSDFVPLEAQALSFSN